MLAMAKDGSLARWCWKKKKHAPWERVLCYVSPVVYLSGFSSPYNLYGQMQIVCIFCIDKYIDDKYMDWLFAGVFFLVFLFFIFLYDDVKHICGIIYGKRRYVAFAWCVSSVTGRWTFARRSFHELLSFLLPLPHFLNNILFCFYWVQVSVFV